MTVSEIVKILTDAGIDPQDARFEARTLVSCLTGASPAQILADPNRDYDSKKLADAVGKRAERYPLQYIVGEWEFCGLPIIVNESCLIPRPDTEITAGRAIELMPMNGRYLDLCTGSGCIAAAVLTYTKDKNSSGYAVELCSDTADTARENIAVLNLTDRCTVVTGDAAIDLFPDETFDIITANPPYITSDEMKKLEPELSFEPRIALTDENDGLSVIRAIVQVYGHKLNPDGTMIIEHGASQAEAVKKIAREYGMNYKKLKDLSANDRAAELTRIH